MATKPFYTTSDIAEKFGVPTWLARRAIDALDEDIPRAGQYRLVPVSLLDRVADEIAKLRTRSQTEETRS
jgi:hypothetical protein